MWQLAIRTELPLKNDAGEIVAEDAWDAQHQDSNAGLWTKPISDWASGRSPAYKHRERMRVVPARQIYRTGAKVRPRKRILRSRAVKVRLVRARSKQSTRSVRTRPVRVLVEVLPSGCFHREICRDARDLVIGCAIHLRSPSCFKYG